MATPVSQHYEHPTVKLKIAGESAAAAPVDSATIDRDLTLELQIHQGETVHQIRGDDQLLSDLVKVLDRYLSYQLQAQPQGTFTGSVAIRPLDFLYHRITVRQGEGIAQVDLSMTQLYDLLEAVEEAKQMLPPLESLRKPARSTPAWYAQPPAIAALLVAGVGLVAAATLFSARTQEGEETFSSSNTQITALDREAANGDPPTPDEEPPEETDTALESERSQAPEVSDPIEEDSDPDAFTSRLSDQPSERSDPSETRAALTDPSEDTAAPQSSTEANPSAPSSEDPDLPSTLGESTDDQRESEAEDLIATLREARQAQQSSLSEAGANLELQLAGAWETPTDLDRDLSYEVIVDEQGTILAVDPQDETAAEQQGSTPLADLESAAETDLPSDTESFRVIFGAEDEITITPN